MTKEDLYISNLKIRLDETRGFATFDINNMDYYLAIYGFSEDELQIIKMNRLYDADVPIRYVDEFIDLFTDILKKYVDAKNNPAECKLFYTFEKILKEPCGKKKIKLNDYKKAIRTGYKAFI